MTVRFVRAEIVRYSWQNLHAPLSNIEEATYRGLRELRVLRRDSLAVVSQPARTYLRLPQIFRAKVNPSPSLSILGQLLAPSAVNWHMLSL